MRPLINFAPPSSKIASFNDEDLETIIVPGLNNLLNTKSLIKNGLIFLLTALASCFGKIELLFLILLKIFVVSNYYFLIFVF